MDEAASAPPPPPPPPVDDEGETDEGGSAPPPAPVEEKEGAPVEATVMCSGEWALFWRVLDARHAASKGEPRRALDDCTNSPEWAHAAVRQQAV